MVKMTKMQQKIYDTIAEALQRQGYPPSVREIGEAVGLKSPSTVHFHLKHMEEMGVLTKGAGKGSRHSRMLKRHKRSSPPPAVLI